MSTDDTCIYKKVRKHGPAGRAGPCSSCLYLQIKRILNKRVPRSLQCCLSSLTDVRKNPSTDVSVHTWGHGFLSSWTGSRFLSNVGVGTISPLPLSEFHHTEDKAGVTAEISPEVITVCSASRSDGDMSPSYVWLRKSKKTCFCETAVICDGFTLTSHHPYM